MSIGDNSGQARAATLQEICVCENCMRAVNAICSGFLMGLACPICLLLFLLLLPLLLALPPFAQCTLLEHKSNGISAKDI